MLSKLKNSERAKKEIKRYKNMIENLPTEDSKNKAQHLLNKLILQSNVIDQAHMFDINNKVDPKYLRENIDKLVKVRIELNKIFRDANLK